MVFFSLLPYTTIFDAIGPSRKTAFWALDLTERRSLRDCPHTECAFW